MNVLPWLLDWPPSPVAVAVFVLLTVASVGTLVVFGGVVDAPADGNVTVVASDLAVRLNDEYEFPDEGNGTVQTCLGSGTPGDSMSVIGDVTVDVPPEEEALTLVVSLAHTDETTTTSLDGTGRVRGDVFWILEDDETLSVGDAATVRLRVRSEDRTLADATRRVTVAEGERSYECRVDPRLVPVRNPG